MFICRLFWKKYHSWGPTSTQALVNNWRRSSSSKVKFAWWKKKPAEKNVRNLRRQTEFMIYPGFGDRGTSNLDSCSFYLQNLSNLFK